MRAAQIAPQFGCFHRTCNEMWDRVRARLFVLFRNRFRCVMVHRTPCTHELLFWSAMSVDSTRALRLRSLHLSQEGPGTSHHYDRLSKNIAKEDRARCSERGLDDVCM